MSQLASALTFDPLSGVCHTRFRIITRFADQKAHKPKLGRSATDRRTVDRASLPLPEICVCGKYLGKGRRGRAAQIPMLPPSLPFSPASLRVISRSGFRRLFSPSFGFVVAVLLSSTESSSSFGSANLDRVPACRTLIF